MVILLIEDNPDDAFLIEKVLKRSNIKDLELIHIERVSQAENIIKKESVELILLDLSLPDTFCLDSIKKLHSITSDIPVVVLTGINDGQLALSAIREGAQDYIYKETLVEAGIKRTIDFAIERHKLIRKLNSHEKGEITTGKKAYIYKKITEQIAEAVAIFDSRGNYLERNNAHKALLGYDDAEIIGQSVECHIGPEKFIEIKNELEIRGCFSGEVKSYTRDEKWINLELNFFTLREGRDNYYIVGLFKDLTPFLLLEEQLRQAQKMESIGKLAGGIAHDFNNLLTVIDGYSSVLLNTLRQGDTTHRAVTEIKKAAERASGLTRQLLTFSKKQGHEVKVLDLNAVISEMSSLLKRLIMENISIKTVLSPIPSYVKADITQIEQVIMNLVVNSCDAMPCGGQINIEVRNIDVSFGKATLPLELEAGKYVLLIMKDNGCGISHEITERIFEPFFTTKRDKGTGLGLSIVNSIVRQCRGKIILRSTPGEGTVFNIYFPMTEAEIKTEAEFEDNEGILSASGNETILLVEDEDILRVMLSKILTINGYTVIDARNGEEALQITRFYKNKIDVMVTDLIMPKMGGYELAEQLSAFFPDMKTIFISGYNNEYLNENILTREGSYILQKPFESDKLLAKIREILKKDSSSSTVNLNT